MVKGMAGHKGYDQGKVKGRCGDDWLFGCTSSDLIQGAKGCRNAYDDLTAKLQYLSGIGRRQPL
jgi:hypothetical protein